MDDRRKRPAPTALSCLHPRRRRRHLPDQSPGGGRARADRVGQRPRGEPRPRHGHPLHLHRLRRRHHCQPVGLFSQRAILLRQRTAHQRIQRRGHGEDQRLPVHQIQDRALLQHHRAVGHPGPEAPGHAHRLVRRPARHVSAVPAQRQRRDAARRSAEAASLQGAALPGQRPSPLRGGAHPRTTQQSGKGEVSDHRAGVQRGTDLLQPQDHRAADG